MAELVEIGKAVNDSERETFAYLRKHLPRDFVIYTNLELAGDTGFPYEFDCIVVGSHAVYSIEIKGYHGKIRGNAREWVLDSNTVVKSPIARENLKAKIVANCLRRRHLLLENTVFVQPLVILSNDRTRFDIDDDQTRGKKRILLHLHEVVQYMKDPRRLRKACPPFKEIIRKLVQDAIYAQFTPLRPPAQIGAYTKQGEIIGQNKLYTSVLAVHPLYPSQRFFLKIYHLKTFARPEELEKYKTWFLQDSRALLRLEGNPGIVQAHPAFFWDDESTIVLPLKWIDGRSLRGLIEAGTSIAFHDKITIILQMAQALAYSHEHGVIHRDVSPNNIIVLSTEDVKAGEVKLVNFDCARIEGSDFATISSLIGRQMQREYIAPELLLNTKNVSPASDQYALGTVLFELLTGRLPESDTPAATNPEDPELSQNLCDIINTMRHDVKEQRYPVMNDVVEALKKVRNTI